MSPRARALQNLYLRHKITVEGLLQAVADGVITPEEFTIITGRPY